MTALAPDAARRALLEATDARVAIDDVVTHPSLTFASAGDRVVLVGDASPILAAISGVPRASLDVPRASDPDDDRSAIGEAFVVRGALLVAGKSVADGAHRSIVGVALRDPPLPVGWTVETYVAWSARLGGASPRQARELTEGTLLRAGLAPARSRIASTLSLPERRALQLAAAIVTDPEVLVVDAPLSGLGGLRGDAAAFVLRALASAAQGRRVIASIDQGDLSAPSAEAAFARSASYLAVLARGALVIEGSAEDLFASAAVYTLEVRSNVEAFREELSARGLELRGIAPRFAVAVQAGSGSREILDAARAARAAVVELAPLIG